MECLGKVSDSLLQNDRRAERESYGRRLLPQVLDEHSRLTPERLYASVPYSADLSQGFRDITCRNMADATNAIAHWLQIKIGRSSCYEVLAYIGIPDLRTAILFLAGVKCGYRVLLLSIRNPIATIASLLEQTECGKLFYSIEVATIAKQLHRKDKVQCFEIPSFDETLLLPCEPYPYNYTFEEAASKPILILHSSGSTGAPKPIPMTHGTFATMDNDRNLVVREGRKRLDFTVWDFNGGGRYYTAFPPFHLAGFVSIIVAPIFAKAGGLVLGPPLRPGTGALVYEMMHYHRLVALFIPPSIAEQLLQEPGGLDNFRNLDWLAYTGGPLSPSAGEAISQVIDIYPFFGVTETLPLQQLIPPREDWAYIEWNPCRKIELQPSDDGAYELVVISDESTVDVSGLNHNYPDVKAWRTKDLFKPHPTKPNLWRFHGRIDDIIALSNGEKFNPVSMEALLQGHPLIKGALVLGQGRAQAALLLESQPGIPNRASLLTDVWPLVEQANLLVPGYGQIVPSKIAVAIEEKPFQRAAKGTILRRLTERSYQVEIEALYKSDEDKLSIQTDLTPPFALEAVKQFVRGSITAFFREYDVGDNDDLFSLGLDSLKAVAIAASFKAGLHAHRQVSELSWVSDRILYSYPTVNQLTAIVLQFLLSDKIPNPREHSENQAQHAHMASLVTKYTLDLPLSSNRCAPRTDPSSITVALTGSTGSLGLYLYEVLQGDSRVGKIYCLNRGKNSKQRHENLSAKRGVCLGSECSKTVFLTVEYGLSNLGLDDTAFMELRDQVDVIIHNAWKVNFKHSLESFEKTHLRGVRRLIDWSIGSKRLPRIFFISSVAAAGRWASVHRDESEPPPIPEAFLDDYRVAAEMGYGKSKLVAEQMLKVASEQAGVPVSILRVGQIAGSTELNDPAWPEQEWIPSLIKTSKSLGAVPNTLPSIDWVPVNLLASIIGEIVHSDLAAAAAEVHNLVNPHTTTWDSLIETLQTYLGRQIAIVTLEEWINKLEKLDALDPAELDRNPAIKLIDLFRDFKENNTAMVFRTKHAVQNSRTLAALSTIDPGMMAIWLKQWDF